MSTSPVKARGSGYGLDAELAKKAADKYDVTMELEARNWIETIAQVKLDSEFGMALKDGVALCKVANAIEPGIVRKIETSSMPFKQMENVSNFLKACRKIGVQEYELFETVDLFELKDLGLVVRCLYALGRTVRKNYPSFQGPNLGVRESSPNKRQFSQKQLSDAKSTASKLNMGSSTTMDRSQVTRSNDVTFGATAPISKTLDSNINTSSGIIPPPIKTKPLAPVTRSRSKSPVSTRGGGYGLDAELAKKAADKYDYDAEEEAQEWIEQIIHERFSTNFADSLKDGQVLCRLVNVIKPGTIRKIETSKIAFKQMENVSNFLKACRSFGVAEFDLFETVDLYEQKDLGVVVRCLHSLGRAIQKNCPEFQGPLLGVRESTANRRKFSEKQLLNAAGSISKLHLGSSETMERGTCDHSASITFGSDNSGTLSADGANTVPKLSQPIAVERAVVDRSRDITFGHDSGRSN